MTPAETSPNPSDSDAAALAPSPLGLAAALTGLVLWALLAGIPFYVSLARSRSFASHELSGLCAGLSLAALLSMGAVSRTRPAYGLALGLGVFPTAVALEAIALGVRSVAHFDPPTRWLAALTAGAYVCLCAAWSGGLPRPLPSASTRPSTSALRDRARPRALPLRRLAPAALFVVSALLGVVLPSIVHRDGGAATARGAGALLLRARDALTAAGGLAVALLLLLSGGSALVRAAPAKGSTTRAWRAVGWLIWAAIVALILVIARQQR